MDPILAFAKNSGALTTPRTVNLESMIAEAAYYRAEKRNFSPGQALNDWLEAKKKINQLE